MSFTKRYGAPQPAVVRNTEADLRTKLAAKDKELTEALEQLRLANIDSANTSAELSEAMERVKELEAVILHGLKVAVNTGTSRADYPDGFDDWSEARKDSWFEQQARAIYMSKCANTDNVVEAIVNLVGRADAAETKLEAEAGKVERLRGKLNQIGKMVSGLSIRLQWVYGKCPICYAIHDQGHKSDCELAAALNTVDSREAGEGK